MPFYPLTAQKIKNFKKWKKPLEISSFYVGVPKIMIRWCAVPEILCTTDGRTDGQKKWHIEVGTSPKNEILAVVLLVSFLTYRNIKSKWYKQQPCNLLLIYLPIWATSSTRMECLVRYQAGDDLALVALGFIVYTQLAML